MEHRVRGREQSTTKITTVVNAWKVQVQDQEGDEPTYHAQQVDHQVRADSSYKVVSPPEEVLFSPPPSQVDLPLLVTSEAQEVVVVDGHTQSLAGVATVVSAKYLRGLEKASTQSELLTNNFLGNH